MNAPDYITPITGYRVWKWNGSSLVSVLNDEHWRPNQPVTARCALFGGLATHRAPHLPCSCGIYATKTLSERFPVYGEVYLWGTVIEHERGWRAQYAYPKSIFVSRHSGVAGTLRSEHDLAPFTAYRADIFLHIAGEDVLLWSPRSGYSIDGLRRLAGPTKTPRAKRGFIALLRDAMRRGKRGQVGALQASS